MNLQEYSHFASVLDPVTVSRRKWRWFYKAEVVFCLMDKFQMYNWILTVGDLFFYNTYKESHKKIQSSSPLIPVTFSDPRPACSNTSRAATNDFHHQYIRVGYLFQCQSQVPRATNFRKGETGRIITNTRESAAYKCFALNNLKRSSIDLESIIQKAEACEREIKKKAKQWSKSKQHRQAIRLLVVTTG